MAPPPASAVDPDLIPRSAFARGFELWRSMFSGWTVIVTPLVVLLTFLVKLYGVQTQPEAVRSAWIDLGLIPLIVGCIFVLGSLVVCCLIAAPRQRDAALRKVGALEAHVVEVERTR